MSKTTESAATKTVYADVLFDRERGDRYSHTICVYVRSDSSKEEVREAAQSAAVALEKRLEAAYEHEELELVAVILPKEYR